MAKKKLTVWADPEVVTYLEYEAKDKAISMSEAANQLLKSAFVEDKEITGAELISLSLRNEMRREFGALANRVTSLMARAATEGIAARYMAYQVVAQEQGKDAANGANRAAWNFAVNQLRKPSREFRELVREWKEAEDEDGGLEGELRQEGE